MYLNNPTIDLVLKARETRAELRQQFAKRNVASVSLTLNIPGFPKSNNLTKDVFKLILEDLLNFLLANRIFVDTENIINNTDFAGQFFVAALDKNVFPGRVKLLVEQFEQTHSLNRIIDVDVFDQKGMPISSGKQKPCIICKNKPAVICMREHNHDYNELRTTIFKMISLFLRKEKDNKIKAKLGELATRALLYEISLSPKPGLVDFLSAGAHSDMNHLTFLNAASALAPYWIKFAEAGIQFDKNLSKALPEIRIIGIEAEKAMNRATGNVNTHKGLIFLMGISVFSTAYVFKKEESFNRKSIVNTIKLISNNLVEKELLNYSKKQSHGETVFNRYGKKGAGARWEVQNGLPTVFENLLPYFDKNLKTESFKDSKEINKILTRGLLISMVNLNDSNILYRQGDKSLKDLQCFAKGVLTGKKDYAHLCRYCLNKNISPGGSADLLAVALFFSFLTKH